MSPWLESWKADPVARLLADRHYNRQKVGAAQFVPPGKCLVWRTEDGSAVWVSSWPIARWVRHAWAGAWINTLFRNEGSHLSSALIRAAVIATRQVWEPPPLGIVSFVDATKVRPKRTPGYCYLKAGWRHVGFTKSGLWVYQQLPAEMP